MRLLNTHTIELQEFMGYTPPYAILSHTWGHDEVSLQEFKSGDKRMKEKEGYSKIVNCCELAASDGFEHAWVDTCCIDKTSSAELSEAINSMYRWYQEADVCYVYMPDVSSNESPKDVGGTFSKSRWFTRGWTLQELIAPANVLFFASEWEEIGTKSSLQDVISSITGIELEILLDSQRNLKDASIAHKMSWAAKRQTTRVEDRAYSLMGLFGINMPMIYGEGDKAFIRLQEHILGMTDDHSIFAWKSQWNIELTCGLLASSPNAFLGSGNIIQPVRQSNGHDPFRLSNLGIQGTLFMKPEGPKKFLAVLDCQQKGENEGLIAIPVNQQTEGDGPTYYVRDLKRERMTVLLSELPHFTRVNIYSRQESNRSSRHCYNACSIRSGNLSERGFVYTDSFSHEWTKGFGRRSAFIYSLQGMVDALSFSGPSGERFVLLLKRRGDMLYATIVQPYPNETPRDVFRSYNPKRNPKNPRYWSDCLDRVTWVHPTKKWSLHVVIKKEIIAKLKTFVVELRAEAED